MNLKVTHAIPGRIRWKADGRLTEEFACSIALRLASLEGAAGCRVNPRNGTVFFAYETKEALAAASTILSVIEVRPARADRSVRSALDRAAARPSFIESVVGGLRRAGVPVPFAGGILKGCARKGCPADHEAGARS